VKTLHLLRHAKSAWDQPRLGDHERPLNKRGQRDAPRMGAALAARMVPMPVALSTARRAQLTLAGLIEGWPELALFQHDSHEALYTFDHKRLLQWLQEQDPQLPQLFIIGHNPALTDLVNVLCPDSNLANLSTAGYVEISLPLDYWDDLAGSGGQLTHLLFPKQL
jgi:phosphohistidine phosphatase